MSSDNNFDWKRLFLRKERPLPKTGCSIAFYIGLLLLIGYIIFSFIKYKNQVP
ncbi:MAG: hypothetical protein J6X58_02415 [Bacteroidales bacterium]|nr:hypothetical protein [Bacteroidales bacterium]